MQFVFTGKCEQCNGFTLDLFSVFPSMHWQFDIFTTSSYASVDKLQQLSLQQTNKQKHDPINDWKYLLKNNFGATFLVKQTFVVTLLSKAGPRNIYIIEKSHKTFSITLSSSDFLRQRLIFLQAHDLEFYQMRRDAKVMFRASWFVFEQILGHL